MPEVARKTDTFDCPGDPHTQVGHSPDVFANNLEVARIGDVTSGHGRPNHGFYPAVPVAEGSGTVFANNIPISRLGDHHVVHCDSHPDCHAGAFNSASSNVFADS